MNGTWFALLNRTVEILARGRRLRGSRRARVLGTLRLVVDFPTWRTLTGTGMPDGDAARVAAAFVAVSGDPAAHARLAA